MNLDEIRALYDQEQRQRIRFPGMKQEVLPYVVRHVDLSGREGVILYSQLNAENVDRIIREQIEYFEKIGQNFEWKYFEHDTPDDLKGRLIAHGFAIDEAEALMVLDLNEAPEVLLRPITRDVRGITTPANCTRLSRFRIKSGEKITAGSVTNWPENCKVTQTISASISPMLMENQ